MAKNTLYRDKEWLENKLLTESVKYISEECKVNNSTIYDYIKLFKLNVSIHYTDHLVKCDSCGIEFYRKTSKKSKDGKLRCKQCLYKTPEEKERGKKWRKKNKKQRREYRMKKLYNISLKDYDNLLEQQNGVCAICKSDKVDSNSDGLVIDHDHESGIIRGLLCDRCNRALGIFRDNPLFLQNAILYLIKSNEDKSWDRYFINIAGIVSTRSKDKSTQVGVVIVRDKVIIATGYNGFPRRINDYDEDRNKRPDKYSWVVHAEENAICNSARQGISTIDSTLYLTPIRPCTGCIRAIIQSGIKRVVCQPLFSPHKWEEEFKISKQMIEECGLIYEEIL